MPPVYNRNEKVDMLLVYGECRQNPVVAQQLYSERYPERQCPARNYFKRLEEQFRREPDVGTEHNIVSEDMEINVLMRVEIDKTVSLREIASELDTSRESVRRILKKHKYRSYKYQIHQHLYEDDSIRRMEYCRWVLRNNVQQNNEFLKTIVFSDESRFTNLGLFNKQNTRYWTQENQHLFRQGNFQERFGFNVWLGVVGDRIIGPIIFDGPLNGGRYLSFLRNEIEDYLEDLPLNLENRLLFQQDGAPPHNSRIVTDYLRDRFGEKWIGTHGPVRWPARSPDLTPLDFFIWGHLKNIVYKTYPTTRDDLELRVRQAIQSITPQQLNNAIRNTAKRARKCLDVGGGHFEQLL